MCNVSAINCCISVDNYTVLKVFAAGSDISTDTLRQVGLALKDEVRLKGEKIQL